jgi:hypothetical protein
LGVNPGVNYAYVHPIRTMFRVRGCRVLFGQPRRKLCIPPFQSAQGDEPHLFPLSPPPRPRPKFTKFLSAERNKQVLGSTAVGPSRQQSGARTTRKASTLNPTKTGFGLHCGWAIQGAIGSEEKIDAIYMSSHVKWAERLEGATKYYGVMILMTGSFFDLLSSEV